MSAHLVTRIHHIRDWTVTRHSVLPTWPEMALHERWYLDTHVEPPQLKHSCLYLVGEWPRWPHMMFFIIILLPIIQRLSPPRIYVTFLPSFCSYYFFITWDSQSTVFLNFKCTFAILQSRFTWLKAATVQPQLHSKMDDVLAVNSIRLRLDFLFQSKLSLVVGWLIFLEFIHSSGMMFPRLVDIFMEQGKRCSDWLQLRGVCVWGKCADWLAFCFWRSAAVLHRLQV